MPATSTTTSRPGPPLGPTWPGGRHHRAVDYATRAGDRALAQLAHDEAAAYYRQALELLDAGRRPDDFRRALRTPHRPG